MANRLAHETSPYLLQHKDNPVDWYPWGPEALEKARAEDKPIFLSIGYSACHWCHVMEYESFESEQIAQKLRDHFVSIKVDREERPDLDQVYMQAVQVMTGHGGWPMSVFLTPDLKPFFGGTYWPPTQQRGMPGFDQILEAVADAWRDRRELALQQADDLTSRLQEISQPAAGADLPQLDWMHNAASKLEQQFDFTHGGFGAAPKFPHAMDLQLLLRIWHRFRRAGVLEMVRLTLDKMARGGIYDHLAGGFARYSVDQRWLVPHFEKMLYDNALLTSAYLDGFLATGEQEYGRVARETIDYILKYMTDERGPFHSTEDADSEGEEGKFYVWTPAEIREILGAERADRFCYVYDVTEQGNFEGHNILNLPKTISQCASLRGWDADELQDELAESREKLLEVRDRRVRPGKDDKVLVSWNGLMIDAVARAAGILDRPTYLQAAERAADFILREMRSTDGRLLHCWRQGQAKFDAYLDDYTCLINALVSIYEAGFEEHWIDEAVKLCEQLFQRFRDRDGMFFYTAEDQEQLITRQKDLYDSSVPSGNSMAATALLRLGKLTGRQDLIEAATQILQAASRVMQQAPAAAGQMLIAADMYLGPVHEIVILGHEHRAETLETLAELRRRFIPNRVVAFRQSATRDGSPHLGALFSGKTAESPEPTVYVCENYSCQAPLHGKEAALEKWRELAG